MPKTIPQRCCVGCRRLAPRDTLIRIVRQHDSGTVTIGEGMGRSAYLCYSVSCFQKVRKKNRLKQALRTPVSDDIYRQLSHLIVRHTGVTSPS